MGSVSGQDVALSTVTAAAISGTYTPPPGYAVARKQIYVRIGTAKSSFSVGSDNTASNAFSFVTPAISGASVTLRTQAQDIATSAQSIGYKANLATNASGVAASSPAAAALTLPADGATAVSTTTPFTWTGVPGAVNILFTAASSTNPRYYTCSPRAPRRRFPI
jgi:hypothetical protein